MAGGNSTSAYNIASNLISDKVFDVYDRQFDLLESLSDIENGGSIDKFLLFFAIEDSDKNRTELSDKFGRDWEDMFIKRPRGEKNDGATESGDAMAYFLKAEYFRKLTGAQALTMINGFDTSLSQHSPDCWGDMLLQIVLVVVVTYLSGGTAGPSALAVVSATISIMHIMMRKPMSKELTMALAVITLGANWSQMTATAATSEIANLALKGLTIYENEAQESRMSDIQEEIKEANEEYDTLVNDKRMHFDFTEMFDYTQREGHEKNPYWEIREIYDPFTIYPGGRDSPWVQID